MAKFTVVLLGRVEFGRLPRVDACHRERLA
jgi:hypothetical protein